MLINKHVSLMKNGFVSFMKNGLKIEPDISHPLGKKRKKKKKLIALKKYFLTISCNG